MILKYMEKKPIKIYACKKAYISKIKEQKIINLHSTLCPVAHIFILGRNPVFCSFFIDPRNSTKYFISIRQKVRASYYAILSMSVYYRAYNCFQQLSPIIPTEHNTSPPLLSFAVCGSSLLTSC